MTISMRRLMVDGPVPSSIASSVPDGAGRAWPKAMI